MADATEQGHLATVGRDYLRDRQRFADFVGAVRAELGDLPSLTDGPLDADTWAFGFAGFAYRLRFLFRVAIATADSGIVLGRLDPESGGWVDLDTVLFDAAGRTGRVGKVAGGLAIPGDAAAVFCQLLGSTLPPR